MSKTVIMAKLIIKITFLVRCTFELFTALSCIFYFLQEHINGLLQKEFSDSIETVLSTVPDAPKKLLTNNT